MNGTSSHTCKRFHHPFLLTLWMFFKYEPKSHQEMSSTADINLIASVLQIFGEGMEG